MAANVVQYRSRLAVRCGRGVGAVLLFACIGAASDWLRGETELVGFCCALVVLAVVLAVLARSLTRCSCTWDEQGIEHAQGRQRWAMAWADLAELAVHADGAGWPEYRLTAADGHCQTVAIKPLGNAGRPLAEELRARYAATLAKALAQVDGPGLPVPAPEGSAWPTALGVLATTAGLAATAVGLRALLAANTEAATNAGIVGTVCLLSAVVVLLCTPRPLLLTRDGLRHGRALGRLLAWPAVERIDLRRIPSRDDVFESVTVRGPGAQLQLRPASYAYLPACAAILAKAVSARFDDRSAASAPPAWHALIQPVFDPVQRPAPSGPARPVAARGPWTLPAGRVVLVVGCVLLAGARLLSPDEYELADIIGTAELADGGQAASAVVTQLCSKRSGTLHAHYKYVVGHTEQQGRTRASSEAGHTWRVGETIAIVYSPSEPSFSRPVAEPAAPVPALHQRYDLTDLIEPLELAGVLVAGVGLLLLLAANLARRRVAKLTRFPSRHGMC